MSANLVVYKTIFVKPSKTLTTPFNINDENAFAVIFKPLQNETSTATLEDIYFLIYADTTETKETITYKVAIFELEDQTSFVPSLTDLEDIENGLWYSEVEVNASAQPTINWVKFSLDATFSDVTKYYALIITSDLEAGATTKNNGVFYNQLEGNPDYSSFMQKSFIFNNYNKEWVTKLNNNINVIPNIFMFSGEIDDTNGLDIGSTSTAGLNSLRGYEVFITIRNDGTTAARNIIIYPTAKTGESSRPEETYLAPSAWFRYDNNYLPNTYQNFENGYKEALNPVSSIGSGDFVLYMQKDRAYPYPKTYVYRVAFTAGTPEIDQDNNAYVLDNNGLVYYSRTNADILVDSADRQFKTFKIYDRNLYRDNLNITLPIGVSSPFIGKYIKRYSDDPIKNAFYISSHDSASQLTVSARRIYPIPAYESTYFDPASRNQSMISRLDLSSIYCHYWDEFRTIMCSNGRFFDPKSITPINNEFQFGRFFALDIPSTETDVITGQIQNKNSASDDQLPYFVVNNITSPLTGQGNYIQTIGFCLFTGTCTHTYRSLLVPEVSDAEALSRLGLMESDKYFSDKYSSAQGLILASHYVPQVYNKEFVDTYIIKTIDNTGIKLVGRLISTAVFTSVETVTSSKLRIYFPKIRFTTEQKIQLLNKTSWLIPNPFGNTNLSSNSVLAGFIIIDVYDHYLFVEGTLNRFSSVANISSFDSSTEVSCYISYYGEGYQAKEDFSAQAFLYFDISGSMLPFYTAANLQNIKDWLDSFSSSTEIRIITDKVVSEGVQPYDDGVFQTDKTTIKSRLDSLWGLINGYPGDEYDAALDYMISEFTSADLDRKIFIFGDDYPTPVGTTRVNSTTLANLLLNLVSVDSIRILISGYVGGGYMADVSDQTGGNYYTLDLNTSKSSLSSVLTAITQVKSLSYGYGIAYGLDKFESVSSNDFFFLYSNGISSDEYGYNYNYGLFSGNVVSEWSSAGTDLWMGFANYNTSTGYITYSGEIALAFDIISTAIVTSSDTCFYSAHNKDALKAFIDTIPAGINVSIRTILSLFGTSSDKTTIKSYVDDLWNAIGTAGTADYNTLLQATIADFTPGAEYKTIILFAANDPTAALDTTTELALQAIDAHVHTVRIAPAKFNAYMPDVSFKTNGAYTTYTINGNLAQILQNMIAGTPLTSDYAYLPPEVKNYSIIVPLIYEDHSASWDEFKALNTEFVGLTEKFVNTIGDTGYEIYQTPVDEWLVSDSTYYICEPKFSPLNSDNITDYSSTITTFTFDNGNAENAYTDNNSWVVDLKLEADGATPKTINDFNRISFLYKIGVPASAAAGANTKVNLLIQSSLDQNFNEESDSTQTLFDGVIDVNPSTFAPNIVSDHVLKTCGYATPDGYNLFMLDLKYRLLGSTYSSSIVRYLRIFMSPTKATDDTTTDTNESTDSSNDSVAQYVTVRALRVTNDVIDTFNYVSTFGSTTDPENILNATGTTFDNNNEYCIIDLGRERHIKRIACMMTSYYGDNDVLTISTKSFINQSQSALSEDIIKEYNLTHSTTVGGSLNIDISTSIFGRLIILKQTGHGSFIIKSLVVSAGANSYFYGSPYETLAMNYDFGFYDEDLRNAPDNRVAVMDDQNTYLGLQLSNNITKYYITQISFSAITEKTTFFQLQKYTDSVAAGVDPDDAGWTTIKTFKVTDYDRFSSTEGIQNIATDNMTIIDTSLPQTKFANNGLAGYLFRPVMNSEILLFVVESYTDGANNYLKVNADIKELGITVGTKYYLEKSNVITFAATEATAIQLKWITGGTVRINNFKAYSNLLVQGTPVAPKTGTDALKWNINIDTI